ncbi:MAG TPA: MFS transporter [Flexilinea sp.]|nr:MAG: Major Facilitator Superfamily protein [Chloroflexi bacterium ADurb.Bin344]HNY93537.1 MFS transporter [Flexilinea sp.]HOG22906.1 MFS transporter [Flexilinea sp.]HOG60675.1 MFS transporter [Flexilinea sp.]HOP01493.1 MFS transporter [Flexilinea sp.]
MNLTRKQWLSLIFIGLTGQLAWMIENMYLNLFMYQTASTDPHYIALMVSASAVVATLTTLLMGNLSDRFGKRKVFISAGYILWGISIILFSFVNRENIQALYPFANASVVAAYGIVVLDCIMTFFGSTANDAAFNAYVTDITVPTNRGKVESVLATFPLIAMLIVFGCFDPIVQQGNWNLFFRIAGGIVLAVGFLSLFFIKEVPVEKKKGNFFAELFYGFTPASFHENKNLYIIMIAFCIFGAAFQVFFPYLIIYIQQFLFIENYALILGTILIIASLISILMGPVIDKYGKMEVIYPAIITMLIGLVGLFFSRRNIPVTFWGIIMMSGYMMISATLSALIRDFTPPGKVGVFQGVRMIFTVMLPMVIGPYIGAWLIKSNGGIYEELGQTKNIPTPDIFLVSAFVLCFIVIPLYFLGKNQHENKMGE